MLHESAEALRAVPRLCQPARSTESVETWFFPANTPTSAAASAFSRQESSHPLALPTAPPQCCAKTCQPLRVKSMGLSSDAVPPQIVSEGQACLQHFREMPSVAATQTCIASGMLHCQPRNSTPVEVSLGKNNFAQAGFQKTFMTLAKVPTIRKRTQKTWSDAATGFPTFRSPGPPFVLTKALLASSPSSRSHSKPEAM